MSSDKESTKNEIAYAEQLCQELEKQVKELETKLKQDQSGIQDSRKKQAILIELKEVQKLLKKYTDQLNHLRTHDSTQYKLIMGLVLVIFLVWMMFVLKSNWGKPPLDSFKTDDFTK